MRSPLRLLAGRGLAVGVLLCLVAPAAAQLMRPDRARLELAADRTAYLPGEEARLVARVEIDAGWHIQAHRPTFDYLIPTRLELDLPPGWAAGEVRYPEPKLWSFAFEPTPLAVYEETIRIETVVTIPPGTPHGPVGIAARLAYQACDDRQCLPPTEAAATLELTVGPGGTAVDLGTPLPPPAAPAAAPRGPGSLWSALGMLLAGLAGGLILNAMPCVLPVLSLKAFGLVKAAGKSRRSVTLAGLATSAGILVSFWALAAAAVIARTAGAAVGWGVQFQEPGFVAFLLAVVALFSLNLWGLFEVPLPRRLAAVADAGGEGGAGHFVSGLFATLMATPCSAPFLGTAVSFALGQPALWVFGIFTAVGTGMALPYLLLAAAPGSARFLPRPGAWMDTLKGLMGFLLAGAAVWLLYVLTNQISAERLLVVELVLLALGLAAWLHHRSRPEGRGRRLAAIGMLAATLGLIAVATTAPAAVPAAAPAAGEAGAGIAWQPFDRAEAEALAAEGRLVFVDVTADWCLTCKVNERMVLGTPEIAAGFARYGVIPMKADWTTRNPAIGDFLAEHGRYGIPFYLLYRPGREPHVFGELLTREGVLAVLADAAAR
ncbi:MAG: Thiol:disulfide interchange protein DsbD precursor [Acidobacteria bacterium ADurb.Bin051]|nr:MAG: Thiol:disulfide interchange protein DsbD precursor [Acidobacteria bacterium ADurb.Bin051]